MTKINIPVWMIVRYGERWRVGKWKHFLGLIPYWKWSQDCCGFSDTSTTETFRLFQDAKTRCEALNGCS